MLCVYHTPVGYQRLCMQNSCIQFVDSEHCSHPEGKTAGKLGFVSKPRSKPSHVTQAVLLPRVAAVATGFFSVPGFSAGRSARRRVGAEKVRNGWINWLAGWLAGFYELVGNHKKEFEYRRVRVRRAVI